VSALVSPAPVGDRSDPVVPSLIRTCRPGARGGPASGGLWGRIRPGGLSQPLRLVRPGTASVLRCRDGGRHQASAGTQDESRQGLDTV